MFMAVLSKITPNENKPNVWEVNEYKIYGTSIQCKQCKEINY